MAIGLASTGLGCDAWYGYQAPSPSPTPSPAAFTDAQLTPTQTACPPSAQGYPDSDGDGYGDSAASPQCSGAPDLVDNQGDCDDTSAVTYPGATELCDGEDNNCDGIHEIPGVFYADLDADGYGDSTDPTSACARPTAHSPIQGDCDDADAAVFPLAQERCDDRRDNDCDGRVDESGPVTLYYDGDGDGFGGVPLSVCDPQPNYITVQGDCDDFDPTVHPGADDPRGDGIDSDCGGRDETDPHVGFGPSSRESIAAALSAAQNGMTVWVGPGTYYETGVSLGAKILSLRATHGPSETVIDAEGAGTVMIIQNGETQDALIEGFTLQGGDAGDGSGGALVVSHASPAFRRMILRYSRAAAGGGLYVQNGGPTFTDSLILQNRASVSGGGIEARSAALTLTDTVVQANLAGAGGAVNAASSDLMFTRVNLIGNVSDGDGGAALIDIGSLTYRGGVVGGNGASGGAGGIGLNASGALLTDLSVVGNHAAQDGGGMGILYGEQRFEGVRLVGNSAGGGGGGLSLEQGSLQVEGAHVVANTALSWGGGVAVREAFSMWQGAIIEANHVFGDGYSGGGGLFIDLSGMYLVGSVITGNIAGGSFGQGGGMYILDAAPVITNIIVEGNEASAQGGGAFLVGSSPPVLFSAFTGNRAAEGGGIYFLDASSPTIDSSILAYNLPNNLHSCCYDDDGDAPAPYFIFSDLYNIAGREDVAPPYIDPGAENRVVEPAFLSYAGGVPTDHHLSAASPLIDGGDSNLSDVDGSRPDMGPYGGPEAGSWDLDGDGLPAYPWPGTYGDQPGGYEFQMWDCDDGDAAVGEDCGG